MKNMYFVIFLLAFILVFSISIVQADNSCKKTCKIKINKKIGPIKNYVTYYGEDHINELKDFDLSIIDASRQNPADIGKLKNPICYLSIGEINTGDTDLASLPEKCFLHNADGTKSVNKGGADWTSYHINTICPQWQKLMKERATKLLSNGCKGIFFDTVDTADKYIQSNDQAAVQSMVGIIQNIRNNNPNAILIQNRGLNVIDKTHNLVNAVMWEAFATEGGNLRPGRDAWFDLKLAELKSYDNLAIISLDYGLNNENEAVRQSLDQGFLPYISPDTSLNKINSNKIAQCNHIIGSK